MISQKYFQIYPAVHVHLKTDKADKKKSHREKFFFCIFFQSTHQVGMKNVVKCYKDFFGYFNALKTRSELIAPILIMMTEKRATEQSCIHIDITSCKIIFSVIRL